MAHGVKNEIAVAEHEIVGKAQHPKALAAQKGIAPFVMRSLFGSVVGSAIQLDDHPGLGTEEIDDVRRDRHLPLEAEFGEPPVLDQRIPQNALRFGRIAAQQPCEAAHRAAVRPSAALSMLGKQGAQHLRLLAVEHPALRVYAVDPGDMRTRMHQDAFPGEDISDRPPPEASVPGLLALVEGDLPSGRYAARALAEAPA